MSSSLHDVVFGAAGVYVQHVAKLPDKHVQQMQSAIDCQALHSWLAI